MANNILSSKYKLNNLTLPPLLDICVVPIFPLRGIFKTFFPLRN